jgi:hypothetical protein
MMGFADKNMDEAVSVQSLRRLIDVIVGNAKAQLHEILLLLEGR